MKIYLKTTAIFMFMGALAFTACFVGGGSGGGGDITAAASTLFASKTSIAAGVECATGGVQIDMGFDVNQNNVLDTEEISKTEYVCNGATGATGETGAAGTNGTNGAAGTDASSHPFVVYSSPAANETSVELNSVINVVFNIEMKSTPASDVDAVTYAGAFTVKDENNNNVSGAVSYAGIVATFIPAQTLIQNKRYSVNLSSAIKNVNGITLGYTHKTYFTTKFLIYSSPNIGKLVYVPSGSFQRDSVSTNISTVTTSFLMSEKEITRAQFTAVTGIADPSNLTYSSSYTDPVQMVSWYHALVFCNKLSIAEGLTPAYTIRSSTVPDAWDGTINGTITVPTATDAVWDAAICNWTASGYRLPTEMEWMWAAMGATSGSGYTYPTYLTGFSKPFAGSNATNAAGNNGTSTLGDYAWYGYTNGNAGAATHPVGTRTANELGLYDMSGNVFEWCWDWYGNYIAGTVTSDSAAGAGAASGARRVMRGGSFGSGASGAAVANRYNILPYSQDYLLGFRVVRP